MQPCMDLEKAQQRKTHLQFSGRTISFRLHSGCCYVGYPSFLGNTMNKYLSTLTLALAVSACSATPYTGETITETTTPTGLNVIQSSARTVLPSGVLAGEESELAQMTATVEEVNVKTRVAKLRTQDGRLVSLKVSPEIRNLAQVKKGDTLVLDYVEAVEFEVRQPTAEEEALAGVGIDVAAAAGKGEKPAAAVASERIDILVVESIDLKKQLITLRGPQGFVTVKSKYPKNLTVIKTGDTVVVKSSELFAARIQPVG